MSLSHRPLLRLGVLAVVGHVLLGCLPDPALSPAETAVPPVAPPPVVEAPPVSAEEALELAPSTIFRHLIDDGDRASLRIALERTMTWLALKPDRELIFGPRTVTAGTLQSAYAELLAFLDTEPTSSALALWLSERYEIYRSVGGPSRRMLITGYYEPLIDGCARKTPECPIPVYGRPPDVNRLTTLDLGDFRDDLAGKKITGRVVGGRFVPYPDRREIREGELLRGREIAWARDKVDLFFIEVQGSGALRLPDGGEIRIGYAGANGRQYRSIGKLLIDQGKVPRERMSMQAIRDYLQRHPEEVDDVLDHNRSVVFFTKLDGPPRGSLGFPVTPGRSVALDHKVFPRAAMAFLVTSEPKVDANGETVAGRPLLRLVFSQDTGGAIKGPGRVDFFWGRGEEAARLAGLMKQRGQFFFLVPR